MYPDLKIGYVGAGAYLPEKVLRKIYGSPVTDKQTRSVRNLSVSEDGTKVSIEVDRLRKGYIYEIKADGVRDKAGNSLVHSFGF